MDTKVNPETAPASGGERRERLGYRDRPDPAGTPGTPEERGSWEMAAHLALEAIRDLLVVLVNPETTVVRGRKERLFTPILV